MTPGSVGFFEIHVDDFQRAQKFYHDVFGWQFSLSASVPSVPYEFYMIDNNQKGDMGLQEGGMRKREKPLTKDNAVSGSVCYIIVEAIDEALDKITKNGGTVTSPKAHIPSGYFAYTLDTEGNLFGVWELEK